MRVKTGFEIIIQLISVLFKMENITVKKDNQF